MCVKRELELDSRAMNGKAILDQDVRDEGCEGREMIFFLKALTGIYFSRTPVKGKSESRDADDDGRPFLWLHRQVI